MENKGKTSKTSDDSNEEPEKRQRRSPDKYGEPHIQEGNTEH